MSDDHHEGRPTRRPGPTVVVLTGGDPVDPTIADEVPDDAFVIAADSGLHTARAFGRRVDLVIGDLDSASPEAVAEAVADGSQVERHPAAKDRTDLELALDRAVERAPARVLVVGGYGGRVDHFVANTLVLASDRYRSIAIEALVGDDRVHVVRDHLDLRGEPGDLITLLPVHGAVHGVTTTGLRYQLEDESLWPGSTRGVSNCFAARHASVEVGEGVLLAVVPGRGGTPPSGDGSNETPPGEDRNP
jgi:thiamine pyrophosphokinase